MAKKTKIISLFLVSIFSIFMIGCGNDDNNINKQTKAETKTEKPQQAISNLSEGKYEIADMKIKLMSASEYNWDEKRVIECALVDKESNQIKTFFSSDFNQINIYKLKDESESYLENTTNHVNIYVSKEMAKNILI